MNFRGRAERVLRGALVAAPMMLMAGGVGGWARGQEPAPLTLHVYEDTIQIPVLVLDRHRKTMAPIAGSKFFGEPGFRAAVPAESCAAGG